MKTREIYIEDKIDQDGEVVIEINGESTWVDRDSAEEIIAHFREVFTLFPNS